MEILEIIKLSTSAVRRNKTRSFLTILGVIIGVFAVISLVSLGTGLRNYITDRFESLGSNNLYVIPGNGDEEGGGINRMQAMSGIGSKLKPSLVDDIKKIGMPIVEVIGELEIPGVVKYRNKRLTATIIGASSEIFTLDNLEIDQGRFFNRSDVGGDRKVAVVGSEVVNKLFEGKDPIGEELIMFDCRFKIIGTLKSRGGGAMGAMADRVTLIPITVAQELSDNNNLQTIMIKISDKNRMDEAKYKVKSQLLKTLKEEDFSVVSQESILSTISSILGVLTTALGCIAAISLLVGGIGIMNIMLVSVTERTREIGIRKAVGATNRNILAQFLTEAVFLSLVGGLIGVFLGYLGTLAVGRLLNANAFSWWSILLALGVSLLVGVIFGVAPAAKAAKLDPVEALRYE